MNELRWQKAENNEDFIEYLMLLPIQCCKNNHIVNRLRGNFLSLLFTINIVYCSFGGL